MTGAYLAGFGLFLLGLLLQLSLLLKLGAVLLLGAAVLYNRNLLKAVTHRAKT